jgi:DNA-binding transcriptional MerR regulator
MLAGMLRIGEFARLNGVSAKMLRAWDALGLFRPAWVDPVTGYRGYSPAQVPELRRLLALREIGVPLAELVELVGGGADLRVVLTRRRRELERQRREIDLRLRALDISVALDAPGSAGLDVVVRPLEREPVAMLPVTPDVDEHDAFYALETVVRDAGRRAARPPGTLLHPYRPDGRRGVDVYVPITGRPRQVAEGDGVTWTHLPAVRAATAIHRGPYGDLEAVAEAVERWVVAAGLVSAGRLRVVYLRFGAEPELRTPPAYLVDRAAEFVTELQLELA